MRISFDVLGCRSSRTSSGGQNGSDLRFYQLASVRPRSSGQPQMARNPVAATLSRPHPGPMSITVRQLHAPDWPALRLDLTPQ
ncbi:hypothetical protein ACIQAR_25765 [Micromonospora chalcea]